MMFYQLFKTENMPYLRFVQAWHYSMDIQVASNFERLLYFILGKNSSKVQEVMTSFRKEGKYCFEKFVARAFQVVAHQFGNPR